MCVCVCVCARVCVCVCVCVGVCVCMYVLYLPLRRSAWFAFYALATSWPDGSKKTHFGCAVLRHCALSELVQPWRQRTVRLPLWIHGPSS